MSQKTQWEHNDFDGLNYKPGKFGYLMEEPFAVEIWNFLKTRKNIQALIDSTAQKKPAIDLLLPQLESYFGAFLDSANKSNDDIPTMVNNMIKQIMDHLGYEHTSCSLYPKARFIRSSGMYEKRN